MENQLFADLSESARRQMLSDNCDRMESTGYMKPFTADEIEQNKDRLAEVSIEMDGIERDKKAANDHYAAQLKPLKNERQEILENVKNKAVYVTEDCYVFVSHEERKVGYYNGLGMLVNARPMRPGESQQTIFGVQRGGEHTGTHD